MAVAEWEVIAPLPTNLTYPSVAAYNDKLFVLGGSVSGPSTNKIYIYDIKKNEWTPSETTLITARQKAYCTAPIVSNRAYLLSGADSTGNCEMYHLTTDSVSVLTDMPLPVRSEHVAVAIGNYIWIIGEETGQVAVVLRFNTTDDTWDSGFTDSPELRWKAAAVAYQKRFVLYFGGYNVSNSQRQEVFKYDTINDSWEQLGNMPNGRAEHSVVYGNGKIWVYGGVDSGSAITRRLDEYDPTTDTYTLLAESNYTRRSHGAVLYKGFMYVIGGTGNLPTGGCERYHAYDAQAAGDDLSEFDNIIYPAPEKLPHDITLQDVEGNKVLQRKLQENFDSIQRQLLALDPDTPNSFDPVDH